LQSFSKDLNDLLVGLLQSEFDAIGMTLIDFNIRMGLHPDSLEVVTRMGYGTSYAQMKGLDVGMAAADNPGGGSNLGELGIGMMGLGAMQQQQALQQMQQQQMQQQMGQQAPPQQQQAAAAGASAMLDIMTPAQAAAVVQVAESDIMAAIEAGELKARKIGTAYRITKANLEEFLGS
jgi:excisionase family DNA binding protein